MILALVVIAAMTFSQALFPNTLSARTQTLAPDSLRGRLTGLQSFDRGSLVVASLIVGTVFDGTSPSTTMAIIGAVDFTMAIACRGMLRRVRQLP